MPHKLAKEQIWDPYHYLERTPGKGLRVKHIEAFNAVLKAPDSVVDRVKAIVERFHTVSLLLDDIEDNAVLRRGRPVAHTIFGAPRTINSASYVMLETLRSACSEFPESQSILFEELISLHTGQGLDLYWRDMNICPTEKEYEEMVLCKTGGLYRLAVRLLQQHSTLSPKPNLVKIADIFGLVYQIQDDLLNLSSERYTRNKGFAEDISEGKYSFPVIHCIRGPSLSDGAAGSVAETTPAAYSAASSTSTSSTSTGSTGIGTDTGTGTGTDDGDEASRTSMHPVMPSAKEIRASLGVELEGILRQHTHDSDLKEHALRCLVAAGSIEYTQNAIEMHYNEALAAIDEASLPDSRPLKVLLDQLVVVLLPGSRDEY